MKLHHIVLAALMATGITQAHAAIFQGATGSPANVVTDYSTESLISFDLDLAELSTVTLNYSVDASDLANGSLSLNGLIRNLSGLGLDGMTFQLSGTNFGIHGTFGTDGFAQIADAGYAQQEGWVHFSPSLTSEFYLGNPLGTLDAQDWGVSLQGLAIGSQIALTVSAVPEPSTQALLLAGLGMMVLARRRQQAR
ncbi:MAG: PEP-CTERM sorting domain-containing protein [Aquabacterium sp.]|jgi:hypothetical protein|uniref:PEP-CTERM sorting domain-containing protein n=1 Tax=Aquabacterium sp. TaxID=1872578 RepID=UPI002A363E39|nr:PEP-CTERM sorting domain-containing protein [Aquabacterium sp.]MDX9843579.1 PEP-CTERM sorting domain-containing protein [Aquabacterium sp.]